MEKEKLPISPSIESRVLFRPDGMAMTDRPTVERPNGIYEKDLPELRQVAIPVARYLLAQGLPMGEICITTSYVDVSTPEAGTPFTDEDQDEILPSSVKDPSQRPVADSDYGVYEKDLSELRRLAIPIARFLIEHGMRMGKVVIQSHRVDAYNDVAGSSFTDENQAEIFRALADKA